MLKNRVNGCHGNHAFFYSAIEFIFEDKTSLHFWGPNERFGTHEKLSWGCKVGQISSRGIRLFPVTLFQVEPDVDKTSERTVPSWSGFNTLLARCVTVTTSGNAK